MTLRQFWMLSVLAGTGGSRPQTELGQQLMVDANNLVLLLNELDQAGWIQRERDPEDRRRHIVVLTERGWAAFEQAELAQEAVEDQVLGALDSGEREQLRALLLKALAT